MTQESLTERLKTLALEAGAVRAGVADATAGVDGAAFEAFRQWRQKGNAADMQYLQRYDDIRQYPARLLEAAEGSRCSLLVCAFPYFHISEQATDSLKLAMYAHGTDYHVVLRQRLAPVAEALTAAGYSSRICVDSAPLAERYWSERAGVGFKGRNGMLIVPDVGSWVVLATIVTDAPLRADAPLQRRYCAGCGACLKACPLGAIGENDEGYACIDARKCLSYLTIEAPLTQENADEIALARSRGYGRCIFGCDICQRVCPHNRHAQPTAITDFNLRPEYAHLTPAVLQTLTPSAFKRLFALSPLLRRRLRGLLFNLRGL